MFGGQSTVSSLQSSLHVEDKAFDQYTTPLLSQQAHAPPPAEGRWRRKRALASVGAALCLKIHFFFHVNSWVAI